MKKSWAVIVALVWGMGSSAIAEEGDSVSTGAADVKEAVSAGETPEAIDAQNFSLPPEFLWDNVITDFDRDRLGRLEEAIALGNEEAYGASASIQERVARSNVMNAVAVPVDDTHLLGWWACRTIKVGGTFGGVIVYSWFDCKVSVRDGFLFFEKRSGSQRLSGRLYQDGPDRRILLAAPTYNDDPQREYSGPEGGITDPQKQDKIGILSELEDGRLRVVFPFPVLESTYDILELKRPD